MTILGISGSFSVHADEGEPYLDYGSYHDSAACLLDSTGILIAAEEERFNREKHTSRFPEKSINACIENSGVAVGQISGIAYFFEEAYTELQLLGGVIRDPAVLDRHVRDLLEIRLREHCQLPSNSIPIHFVSHHQAHAASAFYYSGFAESLVLISDGAGERDCISVYVGDGDGIERVHSYGKNQSLGHFYSAVTKYLGYSLFDEYKVMGLASYGNYRNWLPKVEGIFSLLPNGEYSLDLNRLYPTLDFWGIRPRRKHEPVTKTHQDIAAVAQFIIEQITVHIVRHWMNQTGQSNLSLAGGVAQNTTLNTVLANETSAASVSVPPWPHDAGAAVGAALTIGEDSFPREMFQRVKLTEVKRSPFLGPGVGSSQEIQVILNSWSEVISYSKPQRLYEFIADKIATGSVVGWIQGRSEFGPRSLGNRSILADPRKKEVRDHVNRIIKDREDYRPFAPVILRQYVWDYFEHASSEIDLSAMGFRLKARPEKGPLMEAVVHIDGTARVQTVDEKSNSELALLLRSFMSRSGLPILLNTSFNNSAEPVVLTLEDALSCLLTTELTLLSSGPFVIFPRRINLKSFLSRCRIEIAPFCHIVTEFPEGHSAIFRTSQPHLRSQIPTWIAHSLVSGNWGSYNSAGSYLDRELTDDEFEDLMSLWRKRLVRIRPGGEGRTR